MPRLSSRAALVGALLLCGSALAASPRDTLVIQSSSDIPTLDPGGTYDTASGAIVENLYETLLTYRGNSLTRLEPLLATKWTVSNSGKTYTFDLRPGVKFHSGATMTCADAEYTFRRNIVTNNSSNGNWFMAESLLGTQSNAYEDKSITWARIAAAVKCNSAGQLVFTLPKVDPAFLAKLAYSGQSVIERAYSARLGEWSGAEADWKAWVGKDLSETKLSRAPNGTGAYKFARQDANTFVAQAFDGYWGQKPALRNVVQQKVSELASRQQAFLRGDADLIDGGGRAPDETQLRGRPGVTWLDNLPNVTAGAIVMNQAIKAGGLLGSGKLDGKGIPRDFFSDDDVRRAFSYSFNYAQYISDVLRGKGTQRTMLLPDVFPGYDASGRTYRFDAGQARSAFQRAWGGQVWKNGFVLTANYRAGSVTAQTAMEILKKNVEALNPKFKVNIQPKQWSDMLDASGRGEEAMIILNWAPDYADPDNFMYTYYASDGYYAPRSNYRDERADGWLRAARQTVNMSERTRLYSRVAARTYDLAPYINLPAAVNYIFYRSNLGGISADTYNPMVSFMTGTNWKDLRKN